MIGIKMFDKHWRVKIEQEEWQFETTEKMKECLDSLIEFKRKSGNLVGKKND